MTQFKGRAGTRPTNSQHLPTHSEERKQQGRGKTWCLPLLLELQTHSSGLKLVPGKFPTKGATFVSAQPFVLCMGEVEPQQPPDWMEQIRARCKQFR